MSWELEHRKNLYEIPVTNIVFVANKLQEVHEFQASFGEQGKLNIRLVGVDSLNALVHTGSSVHWWTLGDRNKAILAGSSGYSKGFFTNNKQLTLFLGPK